MTKNKRQTYHCWEEGEDDKNATQIVLHGAWCDAQDAAKEFAADSDMDPGDRKTIFVRDAAGNTEKIAILAQYEIMYEVTATETVQ